MPQGSRRWAGALSAMVLGAALTGCGVMLQDAAEPLPSNALPAPLRIPTPAAPASPSEVPTNAPSPPAEARLRVWFVEDDGLAAVESSLPGGSSADLVLQSLAVGPTPAQAEQGLRTVARDPLTGQALVFVSAAMPVPSSSVMESAGAATGPPPSLPIQVRGSVTVVLSPAFSALPPSEQVLLLGQVVLSLAGAGASTVAFVDDSGGPVAVPLPDGRLLDLPATARDYAGLIVRP